MNKEHDFQEINWKSITVYVDMDTGEILGKHDATMNYIILNTKKTTNVYRKTGTITRTNECRKSPQYKLFQ